jgi:hypothetical protein
VRCAKSYTAIGLKDISSSETGSGPSALTKYLIICLELEILFLERCKLRLILVMADRKLTIIDYF